MPSASADNRPASVRSNSTGTCCSVVRLSTAASTVLHQYGMSPAKSRAAVCSSSAAALASCVASVRISPMSSSGRGLGGLDERARDTVDLGDDLPRTKSRVARRGLCGEHIGRVDQSGKSLRARLRSLFDLKKTLARGPSSRRRGCRCPRLTHSADAAVPGSTCRTSSGSVPDTARVLPASPRLRSGGEP